MKAKKQFTFSGIYAPAPIRWVNALARRSKSVFDRIASLNSEQMIEAAARRTGLQDWGNPRFEEALAALLNSVAQEGKLTLFGRSALKQYLIENLCCRLRVIEVLKRFPEIRQQNIARPVFITEAKSFAWWLLEHDIEHGYQFFKLQLQLLNWLRPDRQWVFKWPYHLWHLETLLKTFPDATIIQLHRDPRQAIPSVCSLAAAASAPFCESVDAAALGEFWLNYCQAGLARGATARQKAKPTQIIDIRYPDLKENPLSVIDQIQNSIDLSESGAWKESLKASLKFGGKKRSEAHHYTAAQFGLEADQIRERFSGYIQDYDLSACAPKTKIRN